MKLQLIAATVMLALPAFGQDIMVTPQQRTIIKEYVVKEKVKPVTMKEKITVGMALPADVELHAVPSDWGPSVTRYRYVNWDNHVVLVEPSSRKVIKIID